jgi:hypothetical protein
MVTLQTFFALDNFFDYTDNWYIIPGALDGKRGLPPPAEIGRGRPEPFNLIRIMPAEGTFMVIKRLRGISGKALFFYQEE